MKQESASRNSSYMVDLRRYEDLTSGTLHRLRFHRLQDLDNKRLLVFLGAIYIDISLSSFADLFYRDGSR